MRHYSYKNDTKVDATSKHINKCVTTPATVHDSKPTKELVHNSNTGLAFLGENTNIGKRVKRINWYKQNNTLNNNELLGWL